MTPQEWEFLLNEMEAALRELWEALTPQQRQVVEEFFLRVWAAIRDARAAGAAAAATSAQQIGAAMRGLIYRLARMGAQGPLNTLLVRVVGILGQWTTMFGGGSAAVGGTATAGGTAATGGTATAGGTAAAAGGAAAAATVAAALFAVAAVITAAISIYSEATTELELPSGGTPCGMHTRQGREMATVNRAITVRAIGSRTSLNKAIAAAQGLCGEDAGNCSGSCGGGKTCLPQVSVIEWEQWYRVFWTTTRIVFRCPCECV